MSWISAFFGSKNAEEENSKQDIQKIIDEELVKIVEQVKNQKKETEQLQKENKLKDEEIANLKKRMESA